MLTNTFTIRTNTRTGKLTHAAHALLLLSLALLSFSCRHRNAPSNTQPITFVVDILSIDRDSTFTDQSPESVRTAGGSYAPASTPSDISLEQANMTDLWVFEGTTLLAHQVSTDPDFGTPEISLSYGVHYITFIASPQLDQSFSAGTWSAGKAADCFGSIEYVDVSSSTSAQAVILMRCTYGLKWQSTDIVPSGVAKLRLHISPMRESMNALLQATNGYERIYDYDVTSYVGRTISVTAYGLPGEYGVEENISTTIEFLSATNAVLYSHTRSVPVLTNRRTIITGPLFNGSAAAAIRLNSQWLTDYETNL